MESRRQPDPGPVSRPVPSGGAPRPQPGTPDEAVPTLSMEQPLSARREAAGLPGGGDSTRALVERAKGGDRGAFDLLIREHFERVYRLLFRLVGNHEDAEDLAQECFVRAWKSLSWFRGDSAFTTWMHTIAVHVARDHHRARGVQRPEKRPVDELRRERDPAAGPTESALGRELVGRLQSSIDKLPERLKAVLVLRVLEGLDYAEIARITGVRPGTARVQMMKARRELSRLLGPWTAGGAADGEGRRSQ